MKFIIVFLLGAGFSFSLYGAGKQFICGARDQSSQICHLASEVHYKDLVDDFLVGARDQFLDLDCGHCVCKACVIGNTLRFDDESCFMCKELLSSDDLRQLGSYSQSFRQCGTFHMISFPSYPEFECQRLPECNGVPYQTINLECGCLVCRGCLLISMIKPGSLFHCFVCSKKLSNNDLRDLKEDSSFVHVACLRSGCSPLRISGPLTTCKQC
ncbi:hypothetical protein IPF37_04405 [bacterium]|nr:MAG: hypothetical protein IPF37_04405 [bacterium]